ncbi:MAG TPA: von Willebrand factor type A domain-containing protein, partial [Gemmatimonadaceae bacterium]|nr:von Willebrand factor type A domain-containing protein [Gemmatimonadaceae bacterium]
MRTTAVHLTLPLLLLAALPARAPLTQPRHQVVVVGRVTDSTSGAAIGLVAVNANGSGAPTDADGRFSFTTSVKLLPETLLVRARRIGYQPVDRKVVAMSDTVHVTISMSPAPTMLQEQVVVAGQALKRSEVVGATTAPIPTIVLRGLASRDALARVERRHDGYATLDTSAVDDACIAAATCPGNTEAYDPIAENPFLSVRSAPRSTFSIDVDRASYSNV